MARARATDRQQPRSASRTSSGDRPALGLEARSGSNDNVSRTIYSWPVTQFQSGKAYVERVRQANPVDEVIKEHLRLRPHRGSELKGACPFHADQFLSLHVNPAARGGRYHCSGCGADGDVFTFLESIEGLAHDEAVIRLAVRAGIGLPPSADDQG